MITVYVKNNCGYSREVLEKLEALHINAVKKNIHEDEGALKELMELGGREQVPFMIDDETHAQMYDSKLICAYLDEHFAKHA